MKTKAIQEALRIIYQNDTSLIITDDDIKRIEQYHQKHLDECSYLDYLYHAGEIINLLSLLQSGRAEVEKQYEMHKALQGGILSECVYAQTLARVFKLDKYIDLDRIPHNQMPVKCKQALSHIKASAQTVSAARYLYYGDNANEYIIQYGNPATGDAQIIYLNEEIHIEFKQPKAKVGEYDLNVDINGKLSVPDVTLNHYGTPLQQCISQFNEKTDLFSSMGRNYKFDESDNSALLQIATKYFEINDVDLLVSAVNNELLVVRPNDLMTTLGNGAYICNLDGSEIRTTGRNLKAVKLHDLLDEALIYPDITHNQDETFTISPVKEAHKGSSGDGYGTVKGRNSNEVSRYKLKYIFAIKKDRALTWTNSKITFTKDAVQEVSPTFSVHITMCATKQELMDLYHTLGVL